MVRKPIPFSKMKSKIGKDGRILYWKSGAWRSKESIEKSRKRTREYQAQNRANLNHSSAERYRTNPEYRRSSREHRIRRKRENPVQFYLANKRHEANRKGLDFNLNEEWYLAHWSQGCEITGRDFDLPEDDGLGNSVRTPWQAEIDRIVPSGPYTMDNCRLVVAIYNRARMNWTDGDVSELANLMTGVSHR